MRRVVDIRQVVPFPADPRSGFFAACRRLWARNCAWRLRRHARRNLEALSDAAMYDIGIHRCEIDSLVAGNDNTRIRQTSAR